MNIYQTDRQRLTDYLIEEKLILFTKSHEKPVSFKIHEISDHRQLREIVNPILDAITHQRISCNGIASTGDSGIGLAAILAYHLRLPHFVLSKDGKLKAKTISVKGKEILFIDDYVLSGETALHAIQTLRTHGAKVKHCLTLLDYGRAKAFKDKRRKIKLVPLITLGMINESVQENENSPATLKSFLSEVVKQLPK